MDTQFILKAVYFLAGMELIAIIILASALREMVFEIRAKRKALEDLEFIIFRNAELKTGNVVRIRGYHKGKH